jgi:hypothetical protein
MNYKLIRQPSTTTGTFGTIYRSDGSILCHTVERPWENNEPLVSCIPNGNFYRCTSWISPSKGHVWRIQDVPDRSDILIHAGNTYLDSEGCLICGDSFGTVHNLPAVLNSVATLDKLRAELPDMFFLTITDDSNA